MPVDLPCPLQLSQDLLEGRQVHLTRPVEVRPKRPIPCGRIDILAEGRWEENGQEVTWRLVIEAKIDAEEGEKQLALYDEWIEEHPGPTEVLRVFLTPDGRKAKTSSAGWQPLTFLELAGILRRASAGLQNKPGYHYLRYYLTGVLKDICGIPLPISSTSPNPYQALHYLHSVLGTNETEADDGHSR